MNENPITIPEPEKILPCHICGADGSERVWATTNAGRGGPLSVSYATPLRVFSDAHPIIGTEVAALVCKGCGNVEFFVNAEDFK